MSYRPQRQGDSGLEEIKGMDIRTLTIFSAASWPPCAKPERIRTSASLPRRSSARVDTTVTSGVLNMCANNYLGLADNPEVIAGGEEQLRPHGASACPPCALSAARSRCTSSWRRRLPKFFGFEDAILYSSCFDANGGLFEALLTAEDAIISDELNHASHHRRRAPVQGQALSLQEQRHGRSEAQSSSRPGTRASS